MSRRTRGLLAILLVVATLTACGSTYVGVGVRRGYPRHYYGRGPFWGYTRYVPVDPCYGGDYGDIDVDYPEAVPLPEPPPSYPDMGMPDMGTMDMGGMDMGGFDF